MKKRERRIAGLTSRLPNMEAVLSAPCSFPASILFKTLPEPSAGGGVSVWSSASARKRGWMLADILPAAISEPEFLRWKIWKEDMVKCSHSGRDEITLYVRDIPRTTSMKLGQ